MAGSTATKFFDQIDVGPILQHGIGIISMPMVSVMAKSAGQPGTGHRSPRSCS